MQSMTTCTQPIIYGIPVSGSRPIGLGVSHQDGPDLTMIGVRPMSVPHLCASDSGVSTSGAELTRILEP